MTKAEYVETLIEYGQAAELYKLMMGTSPFCVGRVRDPNQSKLSIEKLKLFDGGSNYLEFLSKFGTNDVHVLNNGRHYFSRRENFDAWLSNGCIGISEEELISLYTSTRGHMHSGQ